MRHGRHPTCAPFLAPQRGAGDPVARVPVPHRGHRRVPHAGARAVQAGHHAPGWVGCCGRVACGAAAASCRAPGSRGASGWLPKHTSAAAPLNPTVATPSAAHPAPPPPANCPPPRADNAAIFRHMDRCVYRRVLQDDGRGRRKVKVRGPAGSSRRYTSWEGGQRCCGMLPIPSSLQCSAARSGNRDTSVAAPAPAAGGARGLLALPAAARQVHHQVSAPSTNILAACMQQAQHWGLALQLACRMAGAGARPGALPFSLHSPLFSVLPPLGWWLRRTTTS